MLESMRGGSKDAACFLYWILSEEGRTDRMAEVMEVLSKSVEEEHPRSMYCMADALSKGVLVEPDSETAIEYARAAYDKLVLGSSDLLMKLLWDEGSEESIDEVMSIAETQVSHGELKDSIWYARAVIRSKDLENGFHKASDMLDKAIAARIPGARFQKLRLLWEEGSEDSCAKMVKSARPLLAAKHDRAMLLVGKAYLYGKGVKKDTAKAMELFKEAEARNPALKKDLKPLYAKAKSAKSKA